MDGKKELPSRKRLRLQDFDYNTPGAYFITICTHNRNCILSHIVGAIHESPAPFSTTNTVGAIHESPAPFPATNTVGAIYESPVPQLTEYGKIVDDVIHHIPDHYHAYVDHYVIMPNHIHLIIVITDTEDARAIRESPLRGRSVISKMIGYIKMNASKEIHHQLGSTLVWQRGFYDHIIRDRNDYEQITKYIYENPMHWYYDELYAE